MNSSFVDLFSLIYKDAPKPQQSQHSEFTTLKFRKKEGWVKRTIDYIFIAKNNYFKNNDISIGSYIDTKDLENNGLINNDIGNPCENHPSDHYSIAYEV